jgi:uncharacterized membrane protein YbaN (DUF454 family)
MESVSTQAKTVQRETEQGRRLRRGLWFVAGWLCFGLGAIGAVLPGIPTTGPMLLALACFARSSPRFHDWLFHHRVFGPPLQRFKRDRIIPLKAKIMAIGSMALSLSYVAFFSPLPLAAVIGIAAFMAVGAFYILRCPHRMKGEPAGECPLRAPLEELTTVPPPPRAA